MLSLVLIKTRNAPFPTRKSANKLNSVQNKMQLELQKAQAVIIRPNDNLDPCNIFPNFLIEGSVLICAYLRLQNSMAELS